MATKSELEKAAERYVEKRKDAWDKGDWNDDASEVEHAFQAGYAALLERAREKEIMVSVEGGDPIEVVEISVLESLCGTGEE